MFDAKSLAVAIVCATGCTVQPSIPPARAESTPAEEIAAASSTDPSSSVLEVYSKSGAPPGLPFPQIESFVHSRRRDLALTCWDGRHRGWDAGHVEYALAVDPSGAVTPPRKDLDGVTAEIRNADRLESSDELAQCVEQVVQSWIFPRATFPTWMIIEFDFDRGSMADIAASRTCR